MQQRRVHCIDATKNSDGRRSQSADEDEDEPERIVERIFEESNDNARSRIPSEARMPKSVEETIWSSIDASCGNVRSPVDAPFVVWRLRWRITTDMKISCWMQLASCASC